MEIKELFFDIILFGHTTSEPQLITMISLLYDKTFSEDYSSIELNGNTLFVEKCLPYFSLATKEFKNNEEILSIDHFIELYKQLLLKNEFYELLSLLKLQTKETHN
jgi:hypothetical protein